MHPGIDKVAFTGSTEVGKLIVRAAANDLKKISFELGGKSPNVVLREADLDVAVSGTASAIFFNQGQCCCAGSRLFVQESIFDKLVGGVADEAKKIKVGPGLDPATQMGPMVSEIQYNRVCGFRKGESRGANAWSVSPDADFIIPDDRPMYDLALRPRPHRCQVMISG